MNRRSWLLVGGAGVISVGLMVADYFWLKSRAEQRHLRLHPQHQSLGTGPAATNQPPPGKSFDEEPKHDNKNQTKDKT